MYTILEKRVLAENIYLMRIHAPRVARAAKPGQFIIVRIDEFGERVPLTISDYDAEQGSVTIVTQAIGASTRKLCALEQGDALADFVGPLGHPSEFIHEDLDTLRKKRFLFVAGGVGTAPVYPQVKWLHEHGVKADVIIGAKTKSMLIYTEEMARVADNLYIATDDGSEGFKGMVTALIKDLIDNRGKQYDVCVAIGPMIMMKFVTLTTKEYSLPTVVSLNTLMVDGTGMCGACRAARPSSPVSMAPNSTGSRSISTKRCAVRVCTTRRKSVPAPSSRSARTVTNAVSGSTNNYRSTHNRTFPADEYGAMLCVRMPKASTEQ